MLFELLGACFLQEQKMKLTFKSKPKLQYKAQSQ